MGIFRKAHYDKGYADGQHCREVAPNLNSVDYANFVVNEDMGDDEEAGFYDGYQDNDPAPYGREYDWTPAEPPRSLWGRLFG